MTSRKPAPIVKCEHCNWKGSARGLFTHVRLSHPGISAKPPIAQLHHPLDIENSKVGNVKPKRKRKYSSEDSSELLEGTLVALGVAFAIKLLQSLPNTQKQTLQREGINLNQVVTALGKIH
jgi:hypothetical protein